MRFERFSFGTIRIDGSTCEYDVVIDRGEVRKRKKGPSKQFSDASGHTPLSIEEKIPCGNWVAAAFTFVTLTAICSSLSRPARGRCTRRSCACRP